MISAVAPRQLTAANAFASHALVRRSAAIGQAIRPLRTTSSNRRPAAAQPMGVKKSMPATIARDSRKVGGIGSPARRG